MSVTEEKDKNKNRKKRWLVVVHVVGRLVSQAWKWSDLWDYWKVEDTLSGGMVFTVDHQWRCWQSVEFAWYVSNLIENLKHRTVDEVLLSLSSLACTHTHTHTHTHTQASKVLESFKSVFANALAATRPSSTLCDTCPLQQLHELCQSIEGELK